LHPVQSQFNREATPNTQETVGVRKQKDLQANGAGGGDKIKNFSEAYSFRVSLITG